MTAFASQELLVGLIGLALLPIIALRIRRGARDGRLPLYRASITREDGRAKFNVLLALHVLSFVLVAGISADLLFNLGFRSN